MVAGRIIADMPRADGWKFAGKPRIRYRSEAPPQKDSKVLAARKFVYKEDGLSRENGFTRPGSQKR